MLKNDLGLVLSGGGARGIAHLGVLKYLEEIDCRPYFVSGASAGALVGALYAAGYSSRESMEFFKKIDPFSVRNFTTSMPGFINTEKFIDSFKHWFPEDNFQSLERPLFISVTDLEAAENRIIHQGELIRPLLASAAYPVLFSPIQMNNKWYADGGILNNFPVEPLEGKTMDILGVFVNPVVQISHEEVGSIPKVMERAFSISINHKSYKKFERCKLVIVPEELGEFGAFEVSGFETIFEIGYRAAKKKHDQLQAIKNTLP